jgi:extracellular factor (EF) 3-hydroxypalmitic acid methyl ester biosynthesis protein
MTPEQDLEHGVDELTSIAIGRNEDPRKVYHRVAAAMHTLCAAILHAEEQQVDPERIKEMAAPARDLHSCSPFVSRLQTWPRGYAGDFETIEYLCEAANRAEPLTMPWFIESCALHSACAQQHRNKLAWQASKVLQTCLRRREARILSVACGGSRDLRMIQRPLASSAPSVWLNDSDADALTCSREHLMDSGCHFEAVPGIVFRSLRKLEEGAPYDLILTGGLFDYLSERQIVWLLQKLSALLAPGGELCFTNIAGGNPDRVWLEYMANWTLIQRDEPDIERLVQESGLQDSTHLRIERDQTGLTHLVEVALAA